MSTVSRIDERVEEFPSLALRRASRQIEEAIQRSHYTELRGVTCEIDGATLVLRGRVPSFYLKQMAQAIVARQCSGQRVLNLVEVAVAPPF
jgi:hypothetical protein